MNELLLQEKQQIDNLRNRLTNCEAVARFGPEEAGTLVHAFSELEESFRAFINEQLPKLTDPSVRGEQLEDLPLDIREEFRHILYHIHDPEFFRLVEPTHDWLALSESAKT